MKWDLLLTVYKVAALVPDEKKHVWLELKLKLVSRQKLYKYRNPVPVKPFCYDEALLLVD